MTVLRSATEQNQFVAEGAEVDRQSEKHRAEVARITNEGNVSFAENLRQAGPLRRLVVMARVRSEISRRVNELSPSSALYFLSAK